MPSKSRPSILKREREFSKRQRQLKKAAKAALKRARREQGTPSEITLPTNEDAGGGAACAEPSNTAGR
jgi:hypothetical protein